MKVRLVVQGAKGVGELGEDGVDVSVVERRLFLDGVLERHRERRLEGRWDGRAVWRGGWNGVARGEGIRQRDSCVIRCASKRRA